MSDSRGVKSGEFDSRNLSELFAQWTKVQRMGAELEKLRRHPDPHALTARVFDEAKPAGHRVYTIAGSHISSALEHIGTLRHLFTTYGATPRAPWTLLRSVYEAGFWASWLLEPDVSRTRVLRGLRAEVAAARERKNFYEAMFKHDPVALAESTSRHPGHERTWRQEAASLGASWSDVSNRINTVHELQGLTVVQEMETVLSDALVAMWRSLSGMQHGYAYAVVLNSDISDEQPRDGYVHATVTIKESALLAASSAANLLLANGVSLMVQRSTHRSGG